MTRVKSLLAVLFVITLSLVTINTTFALPTTVNTDIYVLPGDDVGYSWYKAWSFTDRWYDAAKNPNQVSHWYDSPDGQYWDTLLSFYLPNIEADDVVAASVNIDILLIWSDDGRDAVGGLNPTGASVLLSEGTGWKSFDVTDWVITALENDAATYDCRFNHTGYSGFTFGSAEGDDPAFLRITTGSLDTGAPVPEPATGILLMSGLLGIAGITRRKQS